MGADRKGGQEVWIVYHLTIDSPVHAVSAHQQVVGFKDPAWTHPHGNYPGSGIATGALRCEFCRVHRAVEEEYRAFRSPMDR